MRPLALQCLSGRGDTKTITKCSQTLRFRCLGYFVVYTAFGIEGTLLSVSLCLAALPPSSETRLIHEITLVYRPPKRSCLASRVGEIPAIWASHPMTPNFYVFSLKPATQARRSNQAHFYLEIAI
jgi:hypothetical protein